jgi:hypothetical protein
MTERTPTPEQHDIIEFLAGNPDTNTMIDAVAGAAKTSTIEMAAPRIRVPSVLAVAFNKKIADELAERLPSSFHCRTLNAVGHGAWQQARGKRQVLDADKMYKLTKAIVPGEADKDSDLFAQTLGMARRAKAQGMVPNGSPMKATGLISDHPDEWEDLAFQLGFTEVDDEVIFYARQVLLKSINAAFQSEIDFDDQIYMSVLFGGVYPQYHTVIVDESQDLSPLNHRQLMKMTQTRLISVGDPRQAIYAFRGADGESMTNLESYMQRPRNQGGIGKGEFKRLHLTKSFRVSKVVGKRQRAHVPQFDTMDFNAEGAVEHWPASKHNEEGDAATSWSLSAIPQTGAVLCRNNAPLMSLAFALIKQRRAVKILGRDIGANLANLLLKITGKDQRTIHECWPKLDEWKSRELAKVPDSEAKQDAIMDRYDALYVLLDASGKPHNLACADFIKDLFSDKPDNRAVTLASGHRAKGLEWDWVMHLDPWRVPSKQAKKAQDRGNDGPMEQELNLRYVIETRTKNLLVLASLDDCLEIGE